MPGRTTAHPRYEEDSELLVEYLDLLTLLDQLHYRLYDVIKDEFENIGRRDINPVQALLLFHIGAEVVTVGELKRLGYYQRSNVSYSLKKLVGLGYLDCNPSVEDRRNILVRSTEKGMRVHDTISDIFRRQVDVLEKSNSITSRDVSSLNRILRVVGAQWFSEIRHIY